MEEEASPEKDFPAADNLTVIQEQKSREYIHSNSDMSTGNVNREKFNKSGASPRASKNFKHRKSFALVESPFGSDKKSKRLNPH